MNLWFGTVFFGKSRIYLRQKTYHFFFLLLMVEKKLLTLAKYTERYHRNTRINCIFVFVPAIMSLAPAIIALNTTIWTNLCHSMYNEVRWLWHYTTKIINYWCLIFGWVGKFDCWIQLFFSLEFHFNGHSSHAHECKEIPLKCK